jgi:hypothetical protein
MRGLPKRPTGNSAEALFMQWVYDMLLSLRMQDTPEALTVRTSRGFSVIPRKKPGGGGGWNYRGDYDSTQAYSKDDVVRVRGGTAQGVYICIRSNPVDLNSGKSAAPEYPEPANQAPPRQNIWEILSLGVVQQSSCVGGNNKTIYINASQPF